MDELEIDEDWLEQMGFALGTIEATRLLPPVDDQAAIVEMGLQRHTAHHRPGVEEWTITLMQGLPHGDDQSVPSDHVVITSFYPRTRGELRNVCAALGAPLPEDKP